MTHELSNLQFWDNFFKFGFVTSFAIPITNYNFKFPNLQLSFCCEFGKFTKLLVWQFCKIAGSAQTQAKLVRY